MAKLLSRFGSKKDLTNRESFCLIRLLDDEEVLQTTFQKEQKGQFLLDYVFKTLNLLEKDYFGLRFVDSSNQRLWLDPTRLISKQVKSISPIIFCFRVKFYPANPAALKEELTRYYLFLQLRRDLLNRRLYCLPSDATYLMACVIQSELGDYNPEEHKDNYVSSFKIIPNQNEKIEMEAIEIHMNEMKNLTPAEAELCFLERASKLETYGIDPYPVKDHKKNQYLIGVNYSGIVAFQGNKKVHHFKWNELQKITYENKMFILHHYSGGKKDLIGFKCPNVASCQNLWRCAVEQRYFFTMNSSNEIPEITTGGGLFSKQCKLRYSGRVERELIEDMKKATPSGSTIKRRHSVNVGGSFSKYGPLGRSNTAPLPDNESPDHFNSSIYEDKNPYLNYSIVSEPSEGYASNKEMTQAYQNSSLVLEPQTFSEGYESSLNPGLATEFDLRPDVTPTGEEPNTISFETPMVRSSPSQLSQNNKSSGEETNDSDETLEQVSEIVDQTPSTYQQNRENVNLKSKPEPGQIRQRKKLFWVKKFCGMLFASLLSALIIILLIVGIIVFILETDSEMFVGIRQLPEMMIFQRDYYQPIKENIMQSIQQ